MFTVFKIFKIFFFWKWDKQQSFLTTLSPKSDRHSKRVCINYKVIYSKCSKCLATKSLLFNSRAQKNGRFLIFFSVSYFGKKRIIFLLISLPVKKWKKNEKRIPKWENRKIYENASVINRLLWFFMNPQGIYLQVHADCVPVVLVPLQRCLLLSYICF